MSMRKKSTRGPAMPETGRGMDEGARAVVSKWIWAVLAVLAGLQIYAGIGMYTARGQVESITAALQRAENRVKITGIKLSDALADKEQALADKQEILSEISAQGQRIAESSQGEEKARAALAAVSYGAETAEKTIAAQNSELADLKTRLARAHSAMRKADGNAKRLKTQITALKSQLDDARAKQENTVGELERLRAAAEPYSTSANPAERRPQ